MSMVPRLRSSHIHLLDESLLVLNLQYPKQVLDQLPCFTFYFPFSLVAVFYMLVETEIQIQKTIYTTELPMNPPSTTVCEKKTDI